MSYAFPSEASHDWLVLIHATEMLKTMEKEMLANKHKHASPVSRCWTFVNVNSCTFDTSNNG